MMTINWQEEANQRRDELLRDLQTLLRINSVRDLEAATPDLPVGPGPAHALEVMLALAEKDGFSVKNVDHLAGRIEFGQGTDLIGMLGHLDVVPAGDGWLTDPFKPVIQDGKIYARGTSDDKGPVMAAYYALKIIKDLNLPVSKQLHFFLGTDEENDWLDADRYFQTEPKPTVGFSPDAEFPIINGEKGIASFTLNFTAATDSPHDVILDTFKSGFASNMIPQTAQAVVITDQPAAIQTAFQTYLKAHHLSGTSEITPTGLHLDLTGKGAHAQEPRDGINAATHLASFLATLELDTLGQHYCEFIHHYLHEDSRGQKLGLAFSDDIMGELTLAPDIFKFNRQQTATILVNVRYPKGIDAETINAQLDQAAQTYQATSTLAGHAETPHYVSGQDPLVKTLLSVYERQTGLEGHEGIVGGGTYGRLLEHGVAFGAQLPGRENVMHQANEYMYIDDIIRACAIYAEAIYELIR